MFAKNWEQNPNCFISNSTFQNQPRVLSPSGSWVIANIHLTSTRALYLLQSCKRRRFKGVGREHIYSSPKVHKCVFTARFSPAIPVPRQTGGSALAEELPLLVVCPNPTAPFKLTPVTVTCAPPLTSPKGRTTVTRGHTLPSVRF